MRSKFALQKERYGGHKKKNKNPDIEDKMDEMFFKKLEEDEKVKQELEDLSKQFENETGGYSDIDLKYARQQKEV